MVGRTAAAADALPQQPVAYALGFDLQRAKQQQASNSNPALSSPRGITAAA